MNCAILWFYNPHGENTKPSSCNEQYRTLPKEGSDRKFPIQGSKQANRRDDAISPELLTSTQQYIAHAWQSRGQHSGMQCKIPVSRWQMPSSCVRPLQWGTHGCIVVGPQNTRDAFHMCLSSAFSCLALLAFAAAIPWKTALFIIHFNFTLCPQSSADTFCYPDCQEA